MCSGFLYFNNDNIFGFKVLWRKIIRIEIFRIGGYDPVVNRNRTECENSRNLNFICAPHTRQRAMSLRKLKRKNPVITRITVVSSLVFFFFFCHRCDIGLNSMCIGDSAIKISGCMLTNLHVTFDKMIFTWEHLNNFQSCIKLNNRTIL